MKLTREQKELLFQQVHCTKYIKSKHCQFRLIQNEKDGEWYYKNSNEPDAEPVKGNTSESTWKHNIKYEIKKCNFTGVVVRIWETVFSTSLGIDGTESLAYPCKQADCSIPVATIFFKNGCKRIVPLECIREYTGFSDGRIIKNLRSFYTALNFENLPANVITELEDGTVQIENTCPSDESDGNYFGTTKRSLLLNVRKRAVRHIVDKGNEWFPVTDEEYTRVMDILNRQMKEECGFVPDLAYGENNFDRLVNFTRYPFVPELNAFSRFLNHNGKESLFTDGMHGEPAYYPPASVERNLQDSPDGVHKFFELCQVPYTPKTNKIVLQGHRTFATFLGLWYCGFRTIRLIEELIENDREKDIYNDFFFIAALGIPVEADDMHTPVLNLTEVSITLCTTSKLLELFGEKRAAQFLMQAIRSGPVQVMGFDTLRYLIALKDENALPAAVIQKISDEGITRYNHDLLMNMYNDLHPERNECTRNMSIPYIDEERQLAWECDGYQFCLPEDTDRLLDIGAKMNICVGHLYREKALTKECTIVYAKKDDEYELCIEVHKEMGLFRLIQRSAFSNHEPKGAVLLAFNKWCREKKIFAKKQI